MIKQKLYASYWQFKIYIYLKFHKFWPDSNYIIFISAIPIPHPVIVKVPQEIKVPVPQPYPVQVEIPHPYPVEVIKHIEIPVEKPEPYYVEKHVSILEDCTFL